MHDGEKSKEQLIEELAAMRRSLAHLKDEVRKLRSQIDGSQTGGSTIGTVLGSQLRAEELFDHIFEESFLGIVQFDPRGVVTECNQAFTEIIGAPRERIIGFDPLARIENQRIRDAVNAALSGSVSRFEGEYVTILSGKHIWIRAVYFPFLDPDGTPRGACGVFEDVTALKEAQTALLRNQERYRRISALTSDIAYSCTKSPCGAFEIDWITGAAERIVGYTNDELKAMKCWRAIVAHEDLPVFEKNVVGISPNTSASCELRLLHKSGEEVWVSSFAECVIDKETSDGLRLYGGLVNITDRKRVEEALKKNHRRLEESQRIARVGTWEWDVLTGEMYWSDELYRIFGLEPQSVVPSYELVRDLTFSADAEMWEQTLNAALESQDTFELEYLALRRDGEVIWIRNEGEIVRDNDGQPTAVVATAQDVTSAKNLEAQLLQAQKMEAVGTLAGGIAHDFNNLLQAMLGYTEILLGRIRPDSRDAQDLRKIQAAGKRGADLVRSLLTFSRRFEPKLRIVDLNQEVLEIHSLLSRTMPKSVRIVLRSKGTLNEVMADPSQLGQIIMNLAVNARDAMPEGGTLTIEMENFSLEPGSCSSEPSLKAGKYVLLTVSDTGYGMEKEVIERIFDPFFSTKGVGKGTGLGLATVYGIVKEHRGHITCSSEPGRGTTFKIYFPAIEREVRLPEEEEDADPQRGTETILLVEDEAALRDVGEYILDSFGYRLLQAADGHEAVKIYRERGREIALIMLDLDLPEMDGEQCLAEIFKMNPDAQVLVVTDIIKSVAKGSLVDQKAAAILSKPYGAKQLLKTIRDILDACSPE